MSNISMTQYSDLGSFKVRLISIANLFFFLGLFRLATTAWPYCWLLELLLFLTLSSFSSHNFCVKEFS
jgi:hypothetical protein